MANGSAVLSEAAGAKDVTANGSAANGSAVASAKDVTGTEAATRYAGAAWLERRLNVECSALGRRVADVLGGAFRGLYHIEEQAGPDLPPGRRRRGGLRLIDWTGEESIVMTLSRPGGLATYDFDELTRLVVLAHDHCVRLELQPHAREQLRLLFSLRARAGDIFTAHPSIEAATEAVRTDVGSPASPRPDAPRSEQ